MALIKLTASELEGVQSQISKMSSKASDCADKVASVRNGLDMEITAKRNIEERLDNIKRNLTEHSDSLKLHANVLNDVINEFVREDSKGNGFQANLPDWFKNAAVIGTAGIVGAAFGGINAPVHTGQGYNWLVQQELNKIKNVTKIFTDSSVEKEETGFWGSLWTKGKEAVESIGNKAKEVYGNVVQAGKDCVSWVRNDLWNEDGSFDTKKLKEYGKAALKIGSSVVKIVGAVSTIAGAIALIPTGVGIPATIAAASPAVLSIVSAGNDFVNGFTDMVYAHEEQYDMVEKTNVLKDYLVDAGGNIGEALGNREVGEVVGSGLYTGINVVTFLDGVEGMVKSLGKVNTVVTGTTGTSSILGKTSFDDIADNKIKFSFSADYFVRKLLKIDPSSDGNIIYEGAKSIYSTLKSAAKIGKEIGNVGNI